MTDMTNKRCGVLFDLDGVLLDSEGQYTIFWERIGNEYPTGIDNFATVIKGTNLAKILSHFESDDVRHRIKEALDAFEKQMTYEFFTGALEFVKSLREAGIPIAIVTSSDRDKMRSLYSQHPYFPTLFDHIVTGDMVTKTKPDPECFLKGAQLLGVDITDCVVFEDSRSGLMAGRASGAKVIGVATTLSRETVEPLCDLTVDAVSELTVERMLSCPKRG